MSATPMRFKVQDGQLIPMNGQPQGGGLSIPQGGGMSVPQGRGMQSYQQEHFLAEGQVIEVFHDHKEISVQHAQMLAAVSQHSEVQYSRILEITEED